MGTHVAILEGRGLLCPGLQDTVAWKFSAPVPYPWLQPCRLSLISGEALVWPGLWSHQEINTSLSAVIHLPSTVELFNCVDAGAAAKASLVRAVWWSRPCLAERYIHYRDSFYRDFQRDCG